MLTEFTWDQYVLVQLIVYYFNEHIFTLGNGFLLHNSLKIINEPWNDGIP